MSRKKEPFQKESYLSTAIFQVTCLFSGEFLVSTIFSDTQTVATSKIRPRFFPGSRRFKRYHFQKKWCFTHSFWMMKINNHLEPQTTIYKWLAINWMMNQIFTWEMVGNRQTSIYKWLFGVPGNSKLVVWGPGALDS